MKSLNVKLLILAAAAAILCVFPSTVKAQTGFANSLGEHLFYIGSDQHVHEFFTFEGRPEDIRTTDIGLSMTSAVSDTVGAPIASFSDYSGEQVYYLDPNFNVHRVFNSNALSEGISAYISAAQTEWQDSLLLPGGFVPLYRASSITGLNDIQNGESIFFIATLSSNNSNNLFWLTCPTGGVCNTTLLEPPKSNWTLQALTAGGAPALGSNLASFVDQAGEHLFYIAWNQHVVEFWRPLNGNWSSQDLTTAPEGCFNPPALPAITGNLSAFSDSSGQHVVFEDASRHIHQLYFNGCWYDQDLSAATGATAAALFPGLLPSALSSFSDGWGEHIFYVDTSARVDQLYYPSGGPWEFQPALANAPAANHCSGLGSFADQNNLEHVGYIIAGSGGHIGRLETPGGPWYFTDMTASWGGPGSSSLCGF